MSINEILAPTEFMHLYAGEVMRSDRGKNFTVSPRPLGRSVAGCGHFLSTRLLLHPTGVSL